MRIIAKATLQVFWAKHADAKRSLEAWHATAKEQRWTTPDEVKATFGNASVISNNRLVFNIKGNDYRLVVAADYERGILFIKFVGTHAEYDQIDAATVAYERKRR